LLQSQDKDFRKIALGFPSLQISPFVLDFSPPFSLLVSPGCTVSHFGFPYYARFPTLVSPTMEGFPARAGFPAQTQVFTMLINV